MMNKYLKRQLSVLLITILLLSVSPLTYAYTGSDVAGRVGTQLGNSSPSTPTPTLAPTPKPKPSPKSQYDDWKLTVTGISTVENSDIIEDTITTDDTVYFSVKLSGGKPGAKTKIHVITTNPSGKKSTYVSKKEWECGQTGWFSISTSSDEGILLREFYDDDGNLIGSGSVKITKSSSSSRSDSRLTESEAKSKAGEAVKKEIYGKYCFKYDSKKTSYSISSAEYKKVENAWIVKGTVTVYYLDGNGSTNGSFEVKIYDWYSGDFGINVSLDIT